ncbi:transcription initiation factor TFIID 23-30kDa subunit-domain-containing protein, partial [Dimargaris cristalligena]
AQAEKEKTLAEFLLAMDDHQPLIPDAVTEYYLARTGFECDDVRIKRLLALVAQKFISDVVTDAFQYSRVHQLNNKERKYTQKDRRSLLTMDDLSQALQEYGVNVRKPEYYS